MTRRSDSARRRSRPARGPVTYKPWPGVSAAQWRSQHLPGRPPKLLADPELRAFVDARIKSMPFVALANETVKQFGPERGIGKSALYEYWRQMVAPAGVRGARSSGDEAANVDADTRQE